ncbi:hypothetical protein MKEN_01453000 [Mycena kentingensis (nom. inval.)]|nr:hypothetical protein MKEN_01453000 [Mycena kentingensis (nom. inval.)]
MKVDHNSSKTPRTRRSSLLSIFQTPTRPKPSSHNHLKSPYERPNRSPRDAVGAVASIFRGRRVSQRPDTPIPSGATAMDESDDGYKSEEDGESHTLSAMGDISTAQPFYVPGETRSDVLMLSPPSSVRSIIRPSYGAHLSQANYNRLHRPAPPARRLTGSRDWETDSCSGLRSPASSEYAPRAETPISICSEVTVRPTESAAKRAGNKLLDTAQTFSSLSSIGTIPDEPDYGTAERQQSTRQSRFLAFMNSRDLTHSPTKKAQLEREKAEQRERLEAFSREVSGSLGRMSAPATPERPLRGGAPLPRRNPIPSWD